MKNKTLFFALTLFLLFSPTCCKAYRPRPKPYYVCQELIRELNKFLANEVDKQNVFPPEDFRFSDETRVIPTKVLYEQAIISNPQIRNFALQNCNFCIAPWIDKIPVKDLSQEIKLGNVVYCQKHGFDEQVYMINNKEVTKEIVTRFYHQKCQEFGIAKKQASKFSSKFDPDQQNLKVYGPLMSNFLLLNKFIGSGGILILHGLCAFIIAFIVFPNKSLKTYFSTDFWITAMGSWLFLEGVYLFIFTSIILDSWGSRYIRFPEPLVSANTFFHLFLILASISLIFTLRALKKPIGRAIALGFAGLIGIIGSNVLSTLIGFWVVITSLSGQCKKIDQPPKIIS